MLSALTQYNIYIHIFISMKEKKNGKMKVPCVEKSKGLHCRKGFLKFSGFLPNAQPPTQRANPTKQSRNGLLSLPFLLLFLNSLFHSHTNLLIQSNLYANLQNPTYVDLFESMI